MAPPVEPEKEDNTTGLWLISILKSLIVMFQGIVLTVLALLCVSGLSVAYLFYKRRNNQPPKLATQIITRPMQGVYNVLSLNKTVPLHVYLNVNLDF